MSNYGPRKPLNWQEGGLEKAVPKNESYESFRQNEIHPVNYKDMDGSANEDMSAAYRVRRYPNGDLDMMWMANQIIDAMHRAESHGVLTPIEMCLLTVIFPMKYRLTEPQQAEIRTQLSKTEKDMLRALIEKQLNDEAGWNAGFGGGGTYRPPHKGTP